jgi:hypothetical protein
VDPAGQRGGRLGLAVEPALGQSRCTSVSIPSATTRSPIAPVMASTARTIGSSAPSVPTDSTNERSILTMPTGSRFR